MQVLDRGTSLTTDRRAEGRARPYGHRPAGFPLASPAAGKTGTQQDNTNSWFVGYTPQLTTAVWVGSPSGYVAMRDIPEFAQFGFDAVQGGRIPAMLWKAYMDPAHANLPMQDWAPPPPPRREPARLFLPGMECRAADRRLRPRRSRARDHTVRDHTIRVRPAQPQPDPTSPTNPPGPQPDPTGPGRPGTSVPRSTTAPPPQTAYIPVYEDVPATTIPPDVLDPNAPLPSVPTDEYVSLC